MNPPRLGLCYRGQRGSVLIYILLGIVLFAALGYTITGMLRAGGDMGGNEKARLAGQALLEYAQQAKTVVQQMRLDNVASADLSFLKTGDAGYTTAPHTAKVFHPNGGGLPLLNFDRELVSDTLTPVSGIYMTRTAIENVGTSADDVVLSIRGVKHDVCANINKQLTGNTTIPSTGANNHDAIFVTGASDLTAGVCATCAGHESLCVSQTGPTIYTFYSVVDGN